jgi:hypothetical protein
MTIWTKKNSPINLKLLQFSLQYLTPATCILLQETVLETDADILFISEHGRNENQISVINMPGYNLVCFYYRPYHTSGGVAMFAKQHLKLQPIKISQST